MVEGHSILFPDCIPEPGLCSSEDHEDLAMPAPLACALMPRWTADLEAQEVPGEHTGVCQVEFCSSGSDGLGAQKHGDHLNVPGSFFLTAGLQGSSAMRIARQSWWGAPLAGQAPLVSRSPTGWVPGQGLSPKLPEGSPTFPLNQACCPFHP